MIDTIKTVDGRDIAVDTLRAIFDQICDQIIARDPEWRWKEAIAYEEAYQGENRTNDVITAIKFHVAGSVGFFMWPQDGVMMIEYTNAGYYANVGA